MGFEPMNASFADWCVSQLRHHAEVPILHHPARRLVTGAGSGQQESGPSLPAAILPALARDIFQHGLPAARSVASPFDSPTPASNRVCTFTEVKLLSTWNRVRTSGFLLTLMANNVRQTVRLEFRPPASRVAALAPGLARVVPASGRGSREASR
jgi:hypothetical protein